MFEKSNDDSVRDFSAGVVAAQSPVPTGSIAAPSQRRDPLANSLAVFFEHTRPLYGKCSVGSNPRAAGSPRTAARRRLDGPRVGAYRSSRRGVILDFSDKRKEMKKFWPNTMTKVLNSNEEIINRRRKRESRRINNMGREES